MDEFNRSLKYALNILNRKDYTEFEMTAKLRKRNINEDVIRNVIQYLKDKTLLSDERFVENFIYFKLNSGYGKKKIGYDLKNKGIKENLIYGKLEDADEFQSAKRIFEKRLQLLKNRENKREKLYSFLTRRGYCYETINKLLNNNKEELV